MRMAENTDNELPSSRRIAMKRCTADDMDTNISATRPKKREGPRVREVRVHRERERERGRDERRGAQGDSEDEDADDVLFPRIAAQFGRAFGVLPTAGCF